MQAGAELAAPTPHPAAAPALPRFRNAGWWGLILPAFLLMTVFYLAPILQVLMISFTEPETGLGNYERLFTSMGVQRVIGTTLRICLITTAVALLLGYALSYVIALAPARAQRWWLLAVLVPLWISVLVAAILLTLVVFSRVVNLRRLFGGGS